MGGYIKFTVIKIGCESMANFVNKAINHSQRSTKSENF